MISEEDLKERLKNLPEAELPENFHAELMAKLRALPAEKKERKYFSSMRRYIPAAAAIVAVIFIIGTVLGLSQKPNTNGSASYAGTLAAADTSADINSPADAGTAAAPPPTARSVGAPTGGVLVGTVTTEENVTPISDALAGESLIRTFNISISVGDIDAALTAIKALPGYTESSNYYGVGSDDTGSASVTRRVDSALYEQAKAALENLGTVTNESEASKNVTNQISDLNAQASAQKEEVSRLMDLLKTSASVSFMTAVENNLEQTSGNLDSTNSQLANLKAQTASPSLNIFINTEAKAPAPEPTPAFSEKLKQAFVDSANWSISVCSTFAVFISKIFVPLAVIAVVVIAVVLIVRRRRRK